MHPSSLDDVTKLLGRDGNFKMKTKLAKCPRPSLGHRGDEHYWSVAFGQTAIPPTSECNCVMDDAKIFIFLSI